jgi:lipopolysaccharide transport system ATP-binding protein
MIGDQYNYFELSLSMTEYAIQIKELGKSYKLFSRSSEKILDALGLSKLVFWRKCHYQEFWALRHLNLDIRKGERIGFIGRNGAGKSTLLKIICSNISPTEGIVSVNGHVQALLELGTGFHPEFTGRENIRASLAYNGLTPIQIAEKEEDIVDFAELEEFIDQPIKTYSAGMYARLAFSAATAIEPEILIIDEVLGAGDAYFTGKCVERMKKLTHESGATVLFVSHDLSSVQALCDRAVWIQRGQIRQDGKPLDIIKNYSALVRKEEETRLRARDLKVSKKQAVLLEKYEDIYETLLFHLVTSNGNPPSSGQRIYGISLFINDQEMAHIDVGGPMDNLADNLNYIMDTPGYMDWGKPEKDGNETYREYCNCKGKYQHAPFEFAVPKTLMQEISKQNNLRLEIEARISQENIIVEVYNKKSYVPIGTLKSRQHGIQAFHFSKDILQFQTPVKLKETTELDSKLDNTPDKSEIDEYGTEEAKINAVKMINAKGEDSRVFQINESLKVILEYETYQELLNPIFVFCVYLPDGKCATQWLSSSEQLNKKHVNGKGKVIFSIDKLVLGKDAYVASAAIFKFLRSDGMEPESYHVLDRCIHFQILQDIEDSYDLGLCVQPFEAKLIHG